MSKPTLYVYHDGRSVYISDRREEFAEGQHTVRLQPTFPQMDVGQVCGELSTILNNAGIEVKAV